MKKILLSLTLMLMVLTLVGCDKKEEVKEKDEVVKKEEVSSWEEDTSTKALALSKDSKKAFNNAIKDYKGMELEAVCLLGTQVVAGTNYMYLVKGTTMGDNPTTSWQIVIVYEDLDGNSEVSRVEKFNFSKYTNKDIKLDKEELNGAFTIYTKNDDNDFSDEIEELYDDILDNEDIEYEVLAFLGTQVSNGTNYAFLAMGETEGKNKEYSMNVVTINKDANNKVTLSSIAEFDLADFNK